MPSPAKRALYFFLTVLVLGILMFLLLATDGFVQLLVLLVLVAFCGLAVTYTMKLAKEADRRRSMGSGE